MHRNGDLALQDLCWEHRPWRGTQAYSDSKLHDTLLAFAVARLWPEVLSNAVEPGWVATRMGGPNATDDLDQGHRTQVWLAVSTEAEATATGGYFYHEAPRSPLRGSHDAAVQQQLLASCAALSGVKLQSSDTRPKG